MKRLFSTLVVLCFAVGVMAQTASHQFEVNTRKLGAEIASTMYGIFFEDVNFAADGGLYAELVKNRSFEFTDYYMVSDIRRMPSVVSRYGRAGSKYRAET